MKTRMLNFPTQVQDWILDRAFPFLQDESKKETIPDRIFEIALEGYTEKHDESFEIDGVVYRSFQGWVRQGRSVKEHQKTDLYNEEVGLLFHSEQTTPIPKKSLWRRIFKRDD